MSTRAHLVEGKIKQLFSCWIELKLRVNDVKPKFWIGDIRPSLKLDYKSCHYSKAPSLSDVDSRFHQSTSPSDEPNGDHVAATHPRLVASPPDEFHVVSLPDKLRRVVPAGPKHVVSPPYRYGTFTSGYKKWQKGNVIGSGSYGLVHEGYNEDGLFFAAKEVSKHNHDGPGKQRIIQLQQEISVLSRLSHENIVQYLGTDEDDEKLYIFLELVTKGSLAELYEKYHLQESQVSTYTRQILSCLNYLRKENVVHRDVKCANILVDVNGSVKLADFGMAKKINTKNGLNSCKGTVYWMAPEVVNIDSTPNKGYGHAADIWSLGCTILEMLTRKIPYSYLGWIPAVLKISRGEVPEIPNTLSAEARDFILQCLQVNTNDRPTAAKLLDHPFVKRPILKN